MAKTTISWKELEPGKYDIDGITAENVVERTKDFPLQLRLHMLTKFLVLETSKIEAALVANKVEGLKRVNEFYNNGVPRNNVPEDS